jgi:hypothetical protein
MIKGKSRLKQVVTFLVALFLLLFVLQGPSQAKSSSTTRNRQVGTAAIAEDKLPWPGIPWLIGGVLTAGTVMVSLKSAKRTHMD